MGEKLLLGWREWAALPDLDIPAIKMKVDTGAKTSALHAFSVVREKVDGRNMVRFSLHPLQKNTVLERECLCPLLDERKVTDSGGNSTMRYVIETRLRMCEREWPIQLTLTNRDSMAFRMLLGRRAMTPDCLVDPSASFLCGALDGAAFYR